MVTSKHGRRYHSRRGESSMLSEGVKENIQAKAENQRPRRHQQCSAFKSCILNSWAGGNPAPSPEGCCRPLGLSSQSQARELLSHATCLRKSPGTVLDSKKLQSRPGGNTELHISWKVGTDAWEESPGDLLPPEQSPPHWALWLPHMCYMQPL